MDRKEAIANDLWLESQLEQLRQIEATVKVDVTEAVMEQLGHTQLLVPAQPQHKRMGRVTTIAAAACFMAAVVVTAVVTRSDVQAASVEQNDFSNRLNDLYDYLDDYTMGEPVENAALYENSIIELL